MSKDNNFINIEDFMKNAIKNSNHIEHIMMGEMLDDVTKDKLLDLLKTPKEIKLTDEGLVFINKNGDEERCVNYGINVTADGKWLSDKILPVSIDIEQGGNIRKAEEAQAAYCLIVVDSVLNEDSISNQIKELVQNYDFERMVPFDGYQTFSKLLEELQNIQSTTINISVCAAKFNISSIKKDSEKFLKENIPEDRISGLRELDTKISAINRSYSLGKLSPENVRNLKKLEILKLLDERNSKIEIILNGGKDEYGNIVKAHPESIIWKILNLSTEFVSPIIKRRLSILADSVVDELYNQNPNLQIIHGEQKTLADKWKSRYIKLARLSLRKTQIEKFLNNESEYTLPPKL